jgi:hypothetical protein
MPAGIIFIKRRLHMSKGALVLIGLLTIGASAFLGVVCGNLEKTVEYYYVWPLSGISIGAILLLVAAFKKR